MRELFDNAHSDFTGDIRWVSEVRCVFVDLTVQINGMTWCTYWLWMNLLLTFFFFKYWLERKWHPSTLNLQHNFIMLTLVFTEQLSLNLTKDSCNLYWCWRRTGWSNISGNNGDWWMRGEVWRTEFRFRLQQQTFVNNEFRSATISRWSIVENN